MSTIVKISATQAPSSPEGEVRLAAGQHVRLRMWREEPPNDGKPMSRHDYEVVGYVLAGHADLEMEGETVPLNPGDSWLVPAGAAHSYRIRDTFTAVEAVAPPTVAEPRNDSVARP